MTDLIKAADALAEATRELRNAQRAYLASKECRDPIDIQQSRGAQVGKCAAIVDTALTAYHQARENADGVKVKPLVWEAISDTSFRAKALMFGNVRVETYGAPWVINWSAPGYCDTLIAGEFDTPEAAKAAAQAYYEARIKAALDT